MTNLLILIHNGEHKIEYERNKPLAGLQRRFLEKMDSDMDSGININGQLIVNPDKMQRTQFISNRLVNSYLNANHQMITTCCAYLAKKIPELSQICVTSTQEHDSVNLVFDDD